MLFKNKNLVSKFFKGLGVTALSATLALGVLSSGVHAMDMKSADYSAAADEDKASEKEGNVCMFCYGEDNDPELGKVNCFVCDGHACEVYFHEDCYNEYCSTLGDRCPICGKKCSLKEKSE